MRLPVLAAAAILASACSGSNQPVAPHRARTGHYFESDAAGGGRLCVSDAGSAQHAVLIAFAPDGANNCSASGALVPKGQDFVLLPTGEGECHIPLARDGDRLTIGQAPAACAYYCGPGASLPGHAYRWVDTSTADLTGQPLMPSDGSC